MKKIIVIGGLSAGPSAAAKARRENEQAEILLFEKGANISYATCGMPYAFSGVIESRDDLMVVKPELLQNRFNIDVHLNEEIYEKRGLKKETSLTVAKELTEHDALAAHIRDELGINEISQAKPMQAAFASGAAFTIGGLLPFLVALFLPLKSLEYSLYGFALLFLIILGALAAKTGGSSILKRLSELHFGELLQWVSQL